MTEEAASTLLRSFSKHKSIDDCVELWTYCQQQGVQPDASSRSAAFSALCDAHEFAWAVEVFESLFRQKIEQPAWVYGRAMHIGTELHRSDLVTNIFEYLVGGSVKLEGEKGVYEMLCDVRGRGVKLSELALRSLLVFADRAKKTEIALEALAMMKDEGFEPTANDYGGHRVSF